MHLPVLYNEILAFLQPQDTGKYVDCTVGTGGHAWGILHESKPDGQLLGMDVDQLALKIASERLAEFGNRVNLVKATYINLSSQLEKFDWDLVDGILFDLGVSSLQLDTPERGFSFQKDAQLDMRFDLDQSLTAAEMINGLSEMELADILHKFGEEPHSRKLARAIFMSKPIETTGQLAQIVARVVPRKRKNFHPATKTFQAFRIALNQELDMISKALPQAILSLRPYGRLAIISFHSLEDRIVKNFFRQEAKGCICPPDLPKCICGHKAMVKIITKKPILASNFEISQNPRARSAKLRVVERI